MSNTSIKKKKTPIGSLSKISSEKSKKYLQMISLLEEIPGRLFDGERKRWKPVGARSRE